MANAKKARVLVTGAGGKMGRRSASVSIVRQSTRPCAPMSHTLSTRRCRARSLVR